MMNHNHSLSMTFCQVAKAKTTKKTTKAHLWHWICTYLLDYSVLIKRCDFTVKSKDKLLFLHITFTKKLHHSDCESVSVSDWLGSSSFRPDLHFTPRCITRRAVMWPLFSGFFMTVPYKSLGDTETE